jgi:hypothetical protein
MNNIPSKPTNYRGYEFRSRLEARWAVFFDAAGIKFHYEYQDFILPSGRYLPDFYLPEFEGGCYAEVKPDRGFALDERQKCRELCEVTRRPVLMLEGPPDFKCTRYFDFHEPTSNQPTCGGDDIELAEMDIVRVLITFGDQTFGDVCKESIAAFVIRNIEDVFDSIEQSLFRKIVQLTMERVKDKLPVNPFFFIHHEDQEVKKLAVDLLQFPYEISPGWTDRFEVYPKLPEKNFFDDALSAVYRLKVRVIRKVIRENHKEMKNISNPDEIAMRQKIHIDLNEKVDWLLGRLDYTELPEFEEAEPGIREVLGLPRADQARHDQRMFVEPGYQNKDLTIPWDHAQYLLSDPFGRGVLASRAARFEF